jgi:hypothetical protein
MRIPNGSKTLPSQLFWGIVGYEPKEDGRAPEHQSSDAPSPQPALRYAASVT